MCLLMMAADMRRVVRQNRKRYSTEKTKETMSPTAGKMQTAQLQGRGMQQFGYRLTDRLMVPSAQGVPACCDVHFAAGRVAQRSGCRRESRKPARTGSKRACTPAQGRERWAPEGAPLSQPARLC